MESGWPDFEVNWKTGTGIVASTGLVAIILIMCGRALAEEVVGIESLGLLH